VAFGGIRRFRERAEYRGQSPSSRARRFGESPPCIETLARTGYRFIAPVEVVQSRPSSREPVRPVRRRVSLAVILLSAVRSISYTCIDSTMIRQYGSVMDSAWACRPMESTLSFKTSEPLAPFSGQLTTGSLFNILAPIRADSDAHFVAAPSPR